MVCNQCSWAHNKAFDKVEDLVGFLYRKYGDEWRRCLLVKREERRGDNQGRDNREKRGMCDKGNESRVVKIRRHELEDASGGNCLFLLSVNSQCHAYHTSKQEQW